MPTNKQNWKTILKGKYAVEKRVDCKPHPHVLKKIGNLKTTIEYLEGLKTIDESISQTCSEDQILKVLKHLRTIGFLDKDTEIYFGFMNDKYWYPKDCDETEAIKTYWFDTMVIKSSDLVKLQTLEKKVRRLADEIGLVNFPEMSPGTDALRLWWD